MDKKCKQCNAVFQSTNTKGSEQLYCSKDCRQKSANERYKSNLINKYNDENKNYKERIDRVQSVNGTSNEGNISFSEKFEQGRNFQNIPSNIIDSIKETYSAKTESIFYKLKCENLEKEIIELKEQIMELESEIDDSENEDEDNSIISGLVTSFKQDPQTTISFASELITNFIKPKTNNNVESKH